MPRGIYKRKPVSEETKNKLKIAGMGNKNHLGKPHTEETKQKIRLSHIGKHNHWTEESKRKMSILQKKMKYSAGHKVSEEHKKKLSLIHTGKKYSLGHTNSELIRKMLSEVNKGSKNPNWNGGSSFEPYTVDWTDTLKRSIKERDHYTCKMCGQLQGDNSFSIHHINYDKKDCDPVNLITLCNNCHLKTNYNREFWKIYFSNINRR